MSSSNSASNTSQKTEDNRAAADNGAIGISADGPVSVHMVADEAFTLGSEVVEAIRDLAINNLDFSSRNVETVADTVSRALVETQTANQSETTKLAENLINVGIPALAVAYVVARIWKG